MTLGESSGMQSIGADSKMLGKCRETNPLCHKLRAINGLQKRRTTGSNPCLAANRRFLSTKVTRIKVTLKSAGFYSASTEYRDGERVERRFTAR